MANPVNANFHIEWIDGEREQKSPPNREFPNGVEIDLTHGKGGCWSALPYPAPRCGAFYVKCNNCGNDALITTAGRIDDPRSITMRCILPEPNHAGTDSRN